MDPTSMGFSHKKNEPPQPWHLGGKLHLEAEHKLLHEIILRNIIWFVHVGVEPKIVGGKLPKSSHLFIEFGTIITPSILGFFPLFLETPMLNIPWIFFFDLFDPSFKQANYLAQIWMNWQKVTQVTQANPGSQIGWCHN